MLKTGNKNISSFIISKLVIVWCFLFCLIYFNPVSASTLSITIKGNLVDTKAKEVPLIEILRAISQKTRIIIETNDSLDEPVTFDINGVSLEESLRQLLGNRNYVITVVENENNLFVPEKVCIFGSGSMTVIGNDNVSSKELIDNDHRNTYKRKSFEALFADSKKLMKQISAKPFADGPLEQGIIITNISENSIFNKMGIRKGDIIKNVNGNPVNTSKQFISQLPPPSEQSTVMIERHNYKGEIDKIYIYLQ